MVKTLRQPHCLLYWVGLVERGGGTRQLIIDNAIRYDEDIQNTIVY